mmetsp:Transcript_8602/g.12660  ORF Transcript_8602/g.12660 Transcript_8602/m.12660 type:complete len:369 (-) Transcript_8602:774-1880(-)
MSDDRRSRSRSPDRDRSPARDHNNGPPSSPPRDNHAPSNGGSGDASSSVKLYIGNIDYGTDDQRLRQTFEKYGAITDAFVPTERESRRPRGFGFVTFARREDAEKAMHELDNTELDGRTIRISESRPRSTTTGPFNASGAADVKLFVGNLSFETETEKIRTLFSTVGEVKDCYMPTDRSSNRPRGFAFVTMSSNDAEDAIKKLIGEDIDGRAIRIEEAGGKSSRPRGEDNFRGGGDRGGFGGGGGYGGGGGDRGGYGGGGGGDRYGDRGGRGGSRDYGDSRRDDRGYGDSRGRSRDNGDRDDSRRDRYEDRGRDSHRSRDDRGHEDRGYGDSRSGRRDNDRDDRYDRDRGDSRSYRDDRGDSRRTDSY